MGNKRKTLCVDFDGVLHSYESGWKGAGVVADGPVPDAVDWLMSRLDLGYDVCVYSSRSKEPEGVEAMKAALLRWGVDRDYLERLDFPTEKPAAWLTIDDRCVRFTGSFRDLSEDFIDNFKPWNK